MCTVHRREGLGAAEAIERIGRLFILEHDELSRDAEARVVPMEEEAAEEVEEEEAEEVEEESWLDEEEPVLDEEEQRRRDLAMQLDDDEQRHTAWMFDDTEVSLEVEEDSELQALLLTSVEESDDESYYDHTGYTDHESDDDDEDSDLQGEDFGAGF